MDDLLKQFQEKLRELEDKIESMRNTINGVLDDLPWWVPDWLIDKVRDGWNWLCTKLQESTEGYYLAADQCGEPWVLRPAADSWNDTVGSGVSGKVSTVDAGLLLADDNWTGTAATQYKSQIPLQKSAIQGIKQQFTDTLHSALDDVASAINVFVAALIVALIALITAVAAAILGCASVVGIPAAIGAVVVALGIGAGAYYAAYTNLSSTGQKAESNMRAKLDDATFYPNGAWPKATI